MISSEHSFDLGITWRLPGARRYAFVFLSLFFTLLLIYSNSFHSPFHFDDTPNILANSNVQPESLTWEELRDSFYGTHLDQERIKRPLSYLSLALNYYFNGEDVFWYHGINFAIHLITAVFLFLLVYHTLHLPLLRPRFEKSAYAISLLAVFFWATHPIQLTAVTYIVQRMAALAGMFYVMAMYFYLKARTSKRRAKQVAFFSFCGVCALAAFASKENAAMLPVALFVFDLFLIRGISRESIKKAAPFAVLPVLVFVLLAVFYVDFSSFLSGYESRPFTLAQRLMTEPRVLMLYISLLFYPVSSRLMLIHDMPLSHSLLDPWTTIASILVIAAAVGAALWYSRKWPLIAFCVIFFFINHGIESTIIPLELVFEHRNYIPSMFFFVLAAVAMVRVLDYFSYRPSIQFLMAFGFCFLLAAQAHTTYERNEVWQNEILLWSDNAQKAPGLSRVHTNLAKAYVDAGIHSEALKHFHKALEQNRVMHVRNRAVLYHNAGLAFHHQENDEAAVNYLRKALEVAPGRQGTLAALCRLYLENGMLEKAYNELRARIRDTAELGSTKLLITWALVMYHRGDMEKAMAFAGKALKKSPGNSDALAIIAQSYKSLGRIDRAAWYWRRYLEKKPESAEARFALIELYAKAGDGIRLSQAVENLFCIHRKSDLCGLVEKMNDEENLLSIYSPDMDSIREAVGRFFSERAERFLACGAGK